MDDIGRADLVFDILEELGDLGSVGRIAGVCRGPGAFAEGRKLFDVPGGKGNFESFTG